MSIALYRLIKPTTNIYPFLRPQYYVIYRLGEVRGISMLFITIDALGGVFSLLSLVFKQKFDALAGVAYSLVVVSIRSHFLSIINHEA